ncbi:MAG: hypothetical protein BAJATHORv1_10522 [Candidatus Thorarchaeota archaeon]|nr:MAG: hypothetical protein BAJATHORv1_10522 [Candidatus Thorarchaeota archaeon]
MARNFPLSIIPDDSEYEKEELRSQFIVFQIIENIMHKLLSYMMVFLSGA